MGLEAGYKFWFGGEFALLPYAGRAETYLTQTGAGNSETNS